MRKSTKSIIRMTKEARYVHNGAIDWQILNTTCYSWFIMSCMIIFINKASIWSSNNSCNTVNVDEDIYIFKAMWGGRKPGQGNFTFLPALLSQLWTLILQPAALGPTVLQQNLSPFLGNVQPVHILIPVWTSFFSLLRLSHKMLHHWLWNPLTSLPFPTKWGHSVLKRERRILFTGRQRSNSTEH